MSIDETIDLIRKDVAEILALSKDAAARYAQEDWLTQAILNAHHFQQLAEGNAPNDQVFYSLTRLVSLSIIALSSSQFQLQLSDQQKT